MLFIIVLLISDLLQVAKNIFFQIDHRTVMVAVGAASNACGTINPIKEISKYATELEIRGINKFTTIILGE